MRSRARLEFEPPTAGLKKVHGMIPLDIFMAKITDGNNKESTRVVFRARGDKQFYFMFSDGAEQNMKVPAGWCQQQLERLMPLEAEKVELPEENIDLPMGDPIDDSTEE